MVVTGPLWGPVNHLSLLMLFLQRDKEGLWIPCPPMPGNSETDAKASSRSNQWFAPTVSIQQRITRGSRKSTVGSITEITQYLRLLYAKIGTQLAFTRKSHYKKPVYLKYNPMFANN